jgi:hypothetical protein
MTAYPDSTFSNSVGAEAKISNAVEGLPIRQTILTPI